MAEIQTLARADQMDERAAGFHQSWFPLALARELEGGKIVGRDFLGTRVVLYRDGAGKPVVHGAWCPHLGADLSVGTLVDGQLRCAYHHWRFDGGGQCVHIPTGDKIPPGARVATYPAAEAWGLIWAFNGQSPLFPVPGIPGADESELVYESHLRGFRNLDPWVAVSNGVDFQHLRALHGLPAVMTPETVEVGDYRLEYQVGGAGYHQAGRITGTNVFAQQLSFGGNEMFMLFAGCAVAHGKSMGFYVYGVRKGFSVAEQQGRLSALKQLVDKLYAEDAAVLDTIRFRKGVLVASDRHLGRFLRYVSEFPRALPPDA
jgi:nitrite reductase/ring-hydroxylating ferredoxin subunit